MDCTYIDGCNPIFLYNNNLYLLFKATITDLSSMFLDQNKEVFCKDSSIPTSGFQNLIDP